MESESKYESQAKRVLAKKELELQRAADKAEAMQNQLHTFHKTLLKNKEVKDAAAQEMFQGIKGQTPVSQVLQKLKNPTINQHGINSDSIEYFGNADNLPTGNGDRYWENEDY